MRISERRFLQILKEETRRAILEDDKLNEGFFDFIGGSETGFDWLKGSKAVVADAKEQYNRLIDASGDENMDRRQWTDRDVKDFGRKLSVLEDFVKYVDRDPPKDWGTEPVKETIGNAIRKYRDYKGGSRIDPTLMSKLTIDQLAADVNELTKNVASYEDSDLRDGVFWKLTDREMRGRDLGRAEDTSRRLRAGSGLEGELASAISKAGGEADNPEAAQMLKARRRGDYSVTDDNMRAMIKRLSSRYSSTMMGRVERFFGGR